MESARTPASRRLLSDLKRQAKACARAGTETHLQALCRLAREHGYDDVDDLQRACDAAAAPPTRTSPAGHPIDPPLRRMFDNTRNEDRSDAELERWWGKPFIISRQTEGGVEYDVRCLDGGAWDRSTWYGHAKTLEECDRIAAEKLARWRHFQNQPVVAYTNSGKIQVVRMPWHPRVDMEVLYEAKDQADAGRFIESLKGQPHDDQTAAG